MLSQILTAYNWKDGFRFIFIFFLLIVNNYNKHFYKSFILNQRQVSGRFFDKHENK